jgi:hypothetical protein
VEFFKPNATEAASWESVGNAARKQLVASGELSVDMAAALDKSLAAARGAGK